MGSPATTRPADYWDYTAEVEFNNEGKLIFYINGEKIHKTRYNIPEQNVTNGGATVVLILEPFND